MDSQPRTSDSDGSAWAHLDETFFQIVQDAFTHEFCFGSSAMLACNDEPEVEIPPQRDESARLSHEETLAFINAEIDRELALRRAMRRHPSRRRF